MAVAVLLAAISLVCISLDHAEGNVCLQCDERHVCTPTGSQTYRCELFTKVKRTCPRFKYFLARPIRKVFTRLGKYVTLVEAEKVCADNGARLFTLQPEIKSYPRSTIVNGVNKLTCLQDFLYDLHKNATDVNLKGVYFFFNSSNPNVYTGNSSQPPCTVDVTEDNSNPQFAKIWRYFIGCDYFTVYRPRFKFESGIVCETDINECTSGGHDCHPNATCTNTDGGFTCTYKPGLSCPPIDKCSTGIHRCDPNAICTTTNQSYTCQCRAGYHGYGHFCQDTNECLSSTHTCDRNAECRNTESSFSCHCHVGYTGTGHLCKDIDDCAAGHNCSNNAHCQDDIASFRCICNSGYSVDGITCKDINECALGQHDCSVHATCSNVQGSFTCKCLPGHTGNGALCSDTYNECLVQNSCPHDKICSSTGRGIVTCLPFQKVEATCPGYTYFLARPIRTATSHGEKYLTKAEAALLCTSNGTELLSLTPEIKTNPNISVLGNITQLSCLQRFLYNIYRNATSLGIAGLYFYYNDTSVTTQSRQCPLDILRLIGDQQPVLSKSNLGCNNLLPWRSVLKLEEGVVCERRAAGHARPDSSDSDSFLASFTLTGILSIVAMFCLVFIVLEHRRAQQECRQPHLDRGHPKLSPQKTRQSLVGNARINNGQVSIAVTDSWFNEEQGVHEGNEQSVRGSVKQESDARYCEGFSSLVGRSKQPGDLHRRQSVRSESDIYIECRPNNLVHSNLYTVDADFSRITEREDVDGSWEVTSPGLADIRSLDLDILSVYCRSNSRNADDIDGARRNVHIDDAAPTVANSEAQAEPYCVMSPRVSVREYQRTGRHASSPSPLAPRNSLIKKNKIRKVESCTTITTKKKYEPYERMLSKERLKSAYSTANFITNTPSDSDSGLYAYAFEGRIMLPSDLAEDGGPSADAVYLDNLVDDATEV